MQFAVYCEARRQRIAESLEAAFAQKITECGSAAGDSAWTLLQLRDFAIGGKMVRGILACLSYEMFAQTKQQDSARAGEAAAPIRLATALELIQAGLLAHDDIMDKDDMRRGRPTLHKTFGQHNKSEQTGEALALCAGDICYFMALKELTSFQIGMGELFSRELTSVCLAQMEDVRIGNSDVIPTLDEVLSMYQYKTGRYTMVLPLQAGALAAGRKDSLPLLEEIGLNLGILFQIEDDRLGLFGDAGKLGKPVGSDIREGKKTPYVLFLLEALPEAEKQDFLQILGRQDSATPEIEYVRSLVTKYGIDQKVYTLAAGYAKKAQVSLQKLTKEMPDIDLEKADLLSQFLDSSLSRTK
ncbi:MAG: polyprenyl synthetase family protein [Spirochaetaceae bacterium]|nr:polyprenyl synthetase family protein [Spirochaetaceae bacterium]